MSSRGKSQTLERLGLTLPPCTIIGIGRRLRVRRFFSEVLLSGIFRRSWSPQSRLLSQYSLPDGPRKTVRTARTHGCRRDIPFGNPSKRRLGPGAQRNRQRLVTVPVVLPK